MSRRSRILIVAACLALTACAGAIAAQTGRGGHRGPPPHGTTIVISGRVFIGGYFYDPMFGPYPWWPRAAYPHWYFPIYDRRAELRVSITPKDASVYVDGFYAGIVDDFDGIMEPLPLPPSGHSVVLYLPGFRTTQYNVYLRPASTFRLRGTLERLPAGEISEPPPSMPAVPPPPPGSYSAPRTPPPTPVPPAVSDVRPPAGFGTLEIHVKPAGAQVIVDGQKWVTSEEGHFVLQVPAGRHQIEVSKSGYMRFSTTIDVPDGAQLPLNVSLMP